MRQRANSNAVELQNNSVFTQSVSTCAGVQQIANNNSEINIFPNPFKDKIIVISELKQTISVFNNLGSLIYISKSETDKTELNLSEQPSGIYFISK